MTIPQITLTGTPYEKGFRHGSQCREQVLCSLTTYRERYAAQRNLTWEEARRIAARFVPVFEGNYAVYTQEMRGIADGAGLDFEDILTLNLRSEILYTGLRDLPEDALECTAFSVVPPAAADGAVLAGQTWDYTRRQRQASFIARFPAEGKRPAMLLFLEGGMVGGKGINAAGLCMTLNALHTKRAAVGVPLHVRMRTVLEQSTLSAAYGKATVGPIPVAACLIITHRDGLSLGLELDPAGVDVLQPEDGVLVHTNHFVGPQMILNHAHNSAGSTYIRYQRATQLLKGRKGITQADLEAMTRDHKGWPTSICAHPAPDTPAERLASAGSTNYAFVADLSQGRLRFVMGSPCEGEYEDIEIE